MPNPWNQDDRPGKQRPKPPPEPLQLCPICLREGTTHDQGSLRTYHCDRNHAWLATKKQADDCGAFQGRLHGHDARNP